MLKQMCKLIVDPLPYNSLVYSGEDVLVACDETMWIVSENEDAMSLTKKNVNDVNIVEWEKQHTKTWKTKQTEKQQNHNTERKQTKKQSNFQHKLSPLYIWAFITIIQPCRAVLYAENWFLGNEHWFYGTINLSLLIGNVGLRMPAYLHQ